MTAVSGHYGKITIGSSNMTECQAWTFNRSATIHPYKSCQTVGTDLKVYTKKVVGGSDGTGNMKGLQDPADQIENYFVEGSTVTLRLYWTAAKYYIVPAVIGKLDVEVDVDAGTPVPWAADFEATGQWTIV